LHDQKITDVRDISFSVTGPNPSVTAGRIFYDVTRESLAYYPKTGVNVEILVGRQLYTRVINNSGATIAKGAAVKIQSSSGGIPQITMANAGATGNQQVVGLVADSILNGEEGFVINNGKLSDLNLSSFSVGDILYLSDGVTGGFVASTDSLAYSSRSNQIGYVLDNGPTAGIIYVSVNNEDINLSLTDLQRNILEGNVISTGTYAFTGLTKISSTTFSVAPMEGWIVNNTGVYATGPTVTNIIYPGATGLSPLNLASADSTYVSVGATGNLILQNTFPTPQQRRERIFLGKVVHPDHTSILNVNNTVDFDVSPVSMIRDIWTPIKLINQGIVVTPNGANLQINTSTGSLWGNGINWVSNQLNPNSVSIAGQSPASFAYRTQTGGTGGSVTNVDPNNYDVGGVITPVSGSQYTNQRIYIFPTGLIRIQYGQEAYTTLAKAITGISAESFIEYVNNRDNGQLIGILSVKAGTTDLSDTNDAQFSAVSKFGELLGGSAGGVSTTDLQQAYDNSTTPEIVTDSTRGAVTFKRGSAADTDNVIEVQDGSGNTNFAVTGQGIVYNNADSQTGLTTGTSTVTSFAVAGGVCAYVEYYIKNSSNSAIRAGVLIATWDGTNITFTDYSTPDLNNPTTGIKLDATISGANVLIRAIITSGTWDVKVGVRIIF